MSAVITGPGAPVQQITTSARAIAAGSSPSATTRVTGEPGRAASRSARRRDRLATTMLAALSRDAVATASALIAPAPTTSTSRPARPPPGRGKASSVARLSRLTPARPIPVSVRGPLARPQRHPALIP